MSTYLSTYRDLPLPFREKKKRSETSAARQACVPQPKREGCESSPSRPAFQVTRFIATHPVVLLLGVTPGMVASFVILFSGAPVCQPLPLPAFPFPSSVFPIGLAGAGGGAGILLWITLKFILKYRPKRRPAQKKNTLKTMAFFATGERIALPPEPPSRQTGELLSLQRDRWISSEWNSAHQRQTEHLEVLHVRQRLRTLRSYYADDLSHDDGQKKFYQIKKLHGRIIFQRRTDAFVGKGNEAL
ncbi:hypothetical protein [Dictyobacter kobayashii]|uniref:hypothetical protein n=1 Tax=Dictyobacter kobayashii TaxID=2014872 RepID=UPI0010A95A6F|nr:hypothetical protein [Dictyobacter kobayashii]